MLIGAVVAFGTAVAYLEPVAAATGTLAGGLLSGLDHHDQLPGRAGPAWPSRSSAPASPGSSARTSSKAGAIALLPTWTGAGVSAIPVLGPILVTDHSVLVYVGFAVVPLAWYWISRTRPGLHLRAVGEDPTAADTLGVNVYRLRYAVRHRGWPVRRPGRRDDHARRLARLVRRPHGERRGLDRRGAR